MSEMISRVEAGIAEAVVESGDREFISKLGLFFASHPGLIGRAAVAAMREPTGDMINAGAATFTFDAGKPDISGQPTKTWQAMIDEVLSA